MMQSSVDLQDLIERARSGSVRGLARLITQVENSDGAARAAVTALYGDTGRAHIVGVTGPPGSGKSSLVTELTKELRRRDKTVAIVAVDPSSPFTGGALLGDRVRMRDLAGDRGVFIRSMASRGSLGGLARATSAVVKLLDAAGYDLVLIETVGAGQAEVDIAAAAHTTLVIEAPGMGDDVQSIKAGILEIADILVVNKADRPGAERTANSLMSMLQLGPIGGTRHHGRILDSHAALEAQDPDAWRIPVHKTNSLEGEGIPELADLLAAHRTHLETTGQWLAREKARSRQEIEQLLQERFMARFRALIHADQREQLITAVAAREIDPYAAAEQIFNQLALSE